MLPTAVTVTLKLSWHCQKRKRLEKNQPSNILLQQIHNIHIMLALWGSFWFCCSLASRTEAHLWLSVFWKEGRLCIWRTLHHNTKHGKGELLRDLLQKHSSTSPKDADVETWLLFLFIDDYPFQWNTQMEKLNTYRYYH